MALTAQAAADLSEIAATHSPLVIDLVNHAISTAAASVQ